MNTKPDDERLALWVEDELDPAEAAGVEAWAAGRPEWLERRDLARASRRVLGGALAADEAVPHGEFFNTRIRREIELTGRGAARSRPASAVRAAVWSWMVPLTAAASLALGFWLGRGDTADAPAGPATAGDRVPVLYTPDSGVEAEYVPTEEATVVVLAGVEAIPDSWDFPETAMNEEEWRPVADASATTR